MEEADNRPAVAGQVEPTVGPLVERLRDFGNEGFPVALEAATELERLWRAVRAANDILQASRDRLGFADGSPNCKVIDELGNLCGATAAREVGKTVTITQPGTYQIGGPNGRIVVVKPGQVFEFEWPNGPGEMGAR